MKWTLWVFAKRVSVPAYNFYKSIRVTYYFIRLHYYRALFLFRSPASVHYPINHVKIIFMERKGLVYFFLFITLRCPRFEPWIFFFLIYRHYKFYWLFENISLEPWFTAALCDKCAHHIMNVKWLIRLNTMTRWYAYSTRVPPN